MPDVNKQIGDILAATRREQKKTLSEVAEGTRIMARYLEAIEAGDQSRLPSPAYFPLFSRSYAQYLGLDPRVIEEVLEADSRETTGEKNDGAKTPPDESELHRQASSFTKTLIIIIVLAIAAFAVILVVSRLGKKSDNRAEVSEDRAVKPDSSATNRTIPKPDSLSAPAEEPPKPLSLHWDIKQDVWAMVIRDGDTVLNRELKAGDQRSWEAVYGFRFTLGISTAVEMTLNGRKLAPLFDRPRTVANLEINQINYKQFLDNGRTDSGMETGTGETSPPRPSEPMPVPAGDSLSRGADGH